MSTRTYIAATIGLALLCVAYAVAGARPGQADIDCRAYGGVPVKIEHGYRCMPAWSVK